MAKPGKKGYSQAIHAATGTDQPCRVALDVVPPVEDRFPRPKWLSAAARNIWDSKVEIYEARGQDISGCGATLAQYCQLEAHLVDTWRHKQVPTMAELTEYRRFCSEFFDTPASKLTRPKNEKPGNRFKDNGI
jgi:hypothetical protein